MNHKRGRPKNRRAGCLWCKPHKMNGYNDESIGSPHRPRGQKAVRNKVYSEDDLKEIKYD